ncbi:MAG: SUMF1/EgtB/PvdO family nonheme iron enzyme, partial [Gammaproteobacteria bacterium]|nr:SUMF1/EgtB/PvdO family nonheme iron enzyme [Gammaproteobacteria bacterium]
LRAELSEKSAALEATTQQQADEGEVSTARNETIEQLRAELSEKSAALEAATQQQADEGEVSTARNETIEQLRAELGEKSAALEATTQQQADEGEVNTALNETIEQLRAELSEKSVALDAATQQQVDNEKANTDLAQTVDQLRAELSEKSAVLNDAAEVALQSPASSATAGDQSRLAVLEAELKTLNEVLDDADGDYDALKQKYEKLEQQLSESVSDSREKDLAVMEQALSQANAKADSLQEDLQRADSEAKRETSAITEQLKEAELKAKERQLNGEADAAENEVLRQEKSALTLSLSEHKGDLELSRKESALLEERIEERNSEVDRLNSALQIAQDELSTSQFDKQAAVEAKESSEQIFNTLQQEIESGQYKADMVDPRINVETLESSSGSRNRSALLAPLMAAVVAFGVADLLSIMAGKGELIGGLIGDERVVVRPSESTFEADPSADDLVAEVPLVTDADWAKSAQQPVAEVAIEPAKTILPTTIKPVGKPVKPSQRVVTVTESEERGPTVVEPTSRAAPAELIRIEPQSAAVPEVKFTPPPTVGPPSGTVVRDRLRSGGQAPEMVYLQGSTFTMGSDRSQLASEERPAHSVSLNNFLIGRHEVTYLEYSQFTQITGRSLPSDLGWGKGNRPVINVSWDDANEYALWLSEQTGKRYRLPTEAEWEYAAAAGTDTLYWWGFQLGDGQANCFNCGSNWDGQSTAPVGAFKANAFGIHNTAGNVMEWVSDCYHDSYRGAPSDGSAWQEQGCRQRVVRGGAFNKPGDSLRTTRRGAHDADTRLFVLGFRLARDASGK